MSELSDSVRSMFETELRNRGISYALEGDGPYSIETGKRSLKVSIDNLERRYQRDGHKIAVLQFVDKILTAKKNLPDWSIASQYVFPILETNELEIGSDTLQRTLSDQAQIVVIFYNDEADYLTFITAHDVSRWKVSLKDVWESASQN